MAHQTGDASEYPTRLLRDDGTPCSVREITDDRSRYVAAAALLRAHGASLRDRHAEVLRRALGLGADAESLAAIARDHGVSRVRIHAIFRDAIGALVEAGRDGPMAVSASTELVSYHGDATEDAVRWAQLSPSQRRVRAVKAANERDGEALWSLTNYYLTTRGRNRGRVSDRTRRAYRRGVLDLVEAFAGENLLQPSSDAGAVWLIRLETEPVSRTVRGERVHEPLSSSTISVKLSAAKALYRALRHVGATEATPFADLSAPADAMAPEAKREAYTVDEVQALLAAAGPLDRAFVHLCVSAGLRNFEATSLTWGQVRRDLGMLKNVVGKGRRIRDVPAAEPLLAALDAIRPADAAAADPVLPFGPGRARERLKALCDVAGIRYVGREVHGLRHTAGTEVTRRHGIDAAADLLRHANLQTTRRYSKRTAAERRRIADDLASDLE